MLYQTKIKKICERAFRRFGSIKHLLLALAFVSGPVSAAPVVGSVTLAASFGFVIESGADAGIDFVDIGSPSPALAAIDSDISTAQLTAVSGDFLTVGITPGSFVSVKDFRFDLTGVDNPIVIGSIFEFSITSVVPPTIFSGSGAPGAGDFSGSGVLVDTTGFFDDTIYDFTFNNVNNSIALITNTAAGVGVVPVPGAVWLFGSSILGLVTIKRRSKKG